MADAPATATQPKKSGSKTLIAALVVIACIGLGAGGSWFMSHRGLASSKAAKKKALAAVPANTPPVAVFPLESFVVNLADPNHSAFLRLGIALGLSKPLPKGSEDPKSSPYTPQIRDVILSGLSSWQSGELLAPDGRAKLKAQLLHALEQKLPEMGIKNIYFTDFLIQQ